MARETKVNLEQTDFQGHQVKEATRVSSTINRTLILHMVASYSNTVLLIMLVYVVCLVCQSKIAFFFFHIFTGIPGVGRQGNPGEFGAKGETVQESVSYSTMIVTLKDFHSTDTFKHFADTCIQSDLYLSTVN